jgi:Protein of unknown function (DUF3016)
MHGITDKEVPVMKPAFTAMLIALCAAATAHAAGSVRLDFVNPDKFTDIRDARYSAKHNLEALQQLITQTAAPYVGDGQTLRLEVLDVDLAGEVRPGHRAEDVRVLRGSTDWPRITLRWTLEGAGPSPRSGQAVVQDMAYLQRIQPPLSDTTLVYERRMLEDWFRREFKAAAAN